MRRPALARCASAVIAVALSILAAPAAAAPTEVDVLADGLDGPSGIFADPAGRLLVAEGDSGSITQIRTHGSWARGVSTFASLPVDPAFGGPVDVARRRGLGSVHVLIGGKLLRVRRGGDSTTVADIFAYQPGDPDPFDLDEPPLPGESNPFGLALLKRGRALVADAANNDLVVVDRRGDISTVARFKTELVPWPEGVDGPPAGTPTPTEAVPTAVAVGPDGAWYVSELKGFPFVPGTSRIWRIEPGTTDATCDPERPQSGPCRTVGTGFTSVIDLAFGDEGTMYVLEIAKEGLPTDETSDAPLIGALWAVDDGSKTELATGELLAPGGVDVDDEKIYVTTGTVFGPDGGAVVRIDEPESDDDDDEDDD